jgi:DNA topoisomerase-6 subunit B
MADTDRKVSDFETKNNKEPIAIELAKAQREISVAEFFEKNRHLLGFDNKKKAILMTVKEAVDNSLDACDESSIMPTITVELTDMGNDRVRVVVEDNGPGIVKKQIPNIFAKLLYGSKFHRLRQSRGQQGIGISAAALYGQLTTGRPIKIISRISKDNPAFYHELLIDTQKNTPEIVNSGEVPWPSEHGTRIELDIEATYMKGPQSVDEFLKQVAIVNPHCEIFYANPKAEQIIFSRGMDRLPKQSSEIKPHPYGVELGMLIKMMKWTECRTLQAFFTQEFSRVGPGTAKEICQNAALLPNTRPHDISREGAEKLIEAIKQTKIIAPPADCLAPIGEEELLKGIKKEINAEFYCVASRPPEVYRGNPFIIEAAIAYGGDLRGDQQIGILRFANKVPLLYQQGACAITDAVSEMNWKSYGVSQSGNSIPVGPILVVVHMASVWVPFTSEAKEAIAHYPEIIKEVKLALQECGRQLSSYLGKKNRVDAEFKKRSYIEKYIPHVGEALQELLKLSNIQKERIQVTLKEILEKNRGELKDVSMENEEYDEEFANIGKEDSSDDSGGAGSVKEEEVVDDKKIGDTKDKKPAKGKKGGEAK